MRLGNLLLVVVLLILLVIIVDPSARQKAVAFVNILNHTVVVNAPSVNESKEASTPVPTRTPVPTSVANNNSIPNTGENQPIIQINWDALTAALRRFWDSLRNIKINLNPAANK